MISLYSLLSSETILQGIRDNISAELLSKMSSAGATLAAILCAASLIISIHRYIRGKEDLFYGILYPLVILALVCQFSTLVISPIDAISRRVTSQIRQSVKVSDKEYIIHWSSASKKVSDLTLENVDKTFVSDIQDISRSNGLERIFKEIRVTLKRTIMRQLDLATYSFSSVLSGVLFLLCKVVLFCQGILSGMLLSLLTLLGPLAFALGVLPFGRSIITRYLGYYINLSLWPIAGLLVMKTNLVVCDSFVRICSNEGGALSLEWMMIALNACALLLILCVPRLCSLVSLAPEAEAIRQRMTSAITLGGASAAESVKKMAP